MLRAEVSFVFLPLLVVIERRLNRPLVRSTEISAQGTWKCKCRHPPISPCLPTTVRAIVAELPALASRRWADAAVSNGPRQSGKLEGDMMPERLQPPFRAWAAGI